jgi:hypothetical protein
MELFNWISNLWDGKPNISNKDGEKTENSLNEENNSPVILF